MKELPYRIILVSLATSTAIAVVAYICVQWFVRLDIEQADASISSPNETFRTFTELSTMTVPKLKEIMLLEAPNTAEGVAALAQTPDDRYLLVIYGNGIFRRWDIETQKPVAEYDFICASKNSASFSADGLLAATPGKVLSTGFNGYNVWNTQTGERVECWGPHCPGGDPDDARFVDSGLFLDPNSRWLIEYDKIGGSAIGLESNVWGGISIPGNGRGPYIKRLIFDKSGTYLAYALDNGSVHVHEIEPFLGVGGGNWRDRVFSYTQSEQQGEIMAFAFDDTRSWLGLVTEDELTVWDLRNVFLSRKFQLAVETANTIAFDRTGRMLAVGTVKGIQILDLEKSEVISEFDVQDVDFIYFTMDNRSLLYADRQGQIHFLGVK